MSELKCVHELCALSGWSIRINRRVWTFLIRHGYHIRSLVFEWAHLTDEYTLRAVAHVVRSVSTVGCNPKLRDWSSLSRDLLGGCSEVGGSEENGSVIDPMLSTTYLNIQSKSRRRIAFGRAEIETIPRRETRYICKNQVCRYTKHQVVT